MEVYLNIAETGIGTYGVNAGAERYFDKDASALSRTEAARIAAVLPLPKERDAVTPTGFTRRYGNSVAARIRVVARDGLDACVYEGAAAPQEQGEKPAPKKSRKVDQQAPPPPIEETAEDYLDAPDIGAPLEAEAPIEAEEAPAPEPPAPEPTPEGP
jgi:monofunctional biosynthetic peptidoglycan transglycosylase